MITTVHDISELKMWYIVELDGVDKHTMALNAGCPQNDNLRVSNDGRFAIVQPLVEPPVDIDAFVNHLNAHTESTLSFDSKDAIRKHLKEQAAIWEVADD